MSKTMTCAVALLVAACGADAGSNEKTNATMNGAGGITAASTAATAQPESWTGEYEGQADNANGVASVVANGRNRYKVTATIFSDHGCGGSVEGDAVVTKGELVMTAPIPDDSGRVCRIVLTNAGKTLRTSTTDCSYFSGASCGFDGRFARKSVAAKSNPSDTGAVGAGESFNEKSNDWLVGGWVIASESCQSFGMTLDKGGTYAADGENGRWQSDGKTLRLTATETYELGSDETPTPVRNPRPIINTIVSSTDSSMTLRFANGTTQKLKKCPAKG